MAAKQKEVVERLVGEMVSITGCRSAEVTMELTGEHAGNVHLRTVDTLGLMLKNGTITSEQYNAGQDFAMAFAIAHLDGFKSVSLDRMPGGGGWTDNITERTIRARQRIDNALEACGGRSSPCGLALWHVVGLGETVKEFCIQQSWNGRRPSQDNARGWLQGALGALAGHYGYTKRFHDRHVDQCRSSV